MPFGKHSFSRGPETQVNLPYGNVGLGFGVQGCAVLESEEQKPRSQDNREQRSSMCHSRGPGGVREAWHMVWHLAIWECRKLGVLYLGALIIRILPFRVLYEGSLFLETPI